MDVSLYNGKTLNKCWDCKFLVDLKRKHNLGLIDVIGVEH